YAGTADGGVWKTTNGTSASAAWTPTSDSQVTLAIGAVAVDPNNPSIVYAGTGEANNCYDCLTSQGVLKSNDGGGHWTLLAGSPVVSTDSGTTWAESTHFETLPNATRLALALGKDSTDHVVAYAAIAACPGGGYIDGQLLGIAKNADADSAGSWSITQPSSSL